jgi:hypothetical protein
MNVSAPSEYSMKPSQTGTNAIKLSIVVIYKCLQ